MEPVDDKYFTTPNQQAGLSLVFFSLSTVFKIGRETLFFFGQLFIARLKPFATASLLLVFAGHAYAQSCSDKLIEAEKLFQQGFLEEVPDKLQECIKEGGFTKEELQDAYKLLIQAYLYDDKPDRADNSMLKFLKKFPEYKIAPADPDIFKYLYGTYNTAPIFAVGAVGGLNLTNYRLLEKIGVQNTSENKSIYSTGGIGFDVGIKLAKNVFKQFELELDMIYNQKKFREIDIVNIFETTSNTTINQFNSIISVVYNFKYQNIIPYARLGYGIGLIDTSYASVQTKYIFKGIERKGAEIGLNNNLLNKNHLAVIGGGVKMPIPTGTIYFDFRYNIGVSEFSDKSKLHVNPELKYKYHEEIDRFTLDNFTIWIGYTYSIYKARKK